MPNSHDHPDLASNTDSIEAIVAQYSSPTPNSSSLMHNQHIYDSSHLDAQETNENDVRMSLSSSPPLHVASNHQTPSRLQHRRSSTHSGYFSRGQLFGRYPTPELPDGPFSSPLANMQQGNSRVLQNRSSIQSLKSTQNEGFSTPNLRSSLCSGQNSTMSLRERFSDSPRDEWMEAGAFAMETAEGSIRSGFVSKFKAAPTFEADQNTGDNERMKRRTSDDGSIRSVSLAKIALRQALGKPLPARKPSWASRIFSLRKSDKTNEAAPQLKTSDEDPVEFGYIEPQVSPESPKDILARVEARKAVESNLPTEVAQEDDNSDTDDSYVNLQDAHDEANPSLAFNPYESLFLLSQGYDAPSTAATAESSELRKNVTAFSLTLTMTTFDQAPVPPVNDLGYAAPTTIFSQDPILRPHRLTMSPIQAAISQSPITPVQRQGLAFSDANAIIYGCMSFAAMHTVLINMGEDVRAIDIAYNMSVAFVIGVALCLVLQWVQGGRINDILRATKYPLGTTYETLLNKFRQARDE